MPLSIALSLSLSQVIYWLSGRSVLQELLGRRQGAQWSGNDKSECVCVSVFLATCPKNCQASAPAECVCVCVLVRVCVCV